MTAGTARRAFFVAGVYFAVAGVYILVSSRLAEWVVDDVTRLRRVEEIKGLVFVGVTAAVVFAATFGVLRRAERIARKVARQREAIVASERQALAGMMAAAIAHDANNVLASLLIDLELLELGRGDAESVSSALAAVARLAELNRRLLNAARQQSTTDVRDIDVGRAVQGTLDVLRFHVALRECKVELAASDHAIIRANPVLIHQVVSNFVVNAGEATGGKGRICLAVEREAHSGTVRIHVDDDGPGIPAQRRAEIFSALKTTKATGTGLGLYSARACATAIGGSVEVGDSPLGGARFTAVFPRPLDGPAPSPLESSVALDSSAG